MRLREVTVGRRVRIGAEEYEVLRQGSAGTIVAPCAEKLVEVGGRAFRARRGRPVQFSGAAEVTLTEGGSK